jgi:hypothetical protein
MEEREQKAVRALVSMTRQFLHKRDDLIDSSAISAGEQTIEALAAYGLMEIVFKGRMFAKWTEAAPEILKSIKA